MDDILEESLQKMVDELKDETEMTEKQRQILRASVKLFADKGFHATSTAEIAKEAKVAEGTIFRHYKSKKDILMAVVAPAMVKYITPLVLHDVRKIIKEQEEKSFAEVVQAILKNRLVLIESHFKQFRILIQEAFFNEELREVLIHSFVREARTVVEQFVSERIAKGELRPLPPEVIVRCLIFNMMGIIMFKNVIDPEKYRQYTDDEQIALTVDILLNGIANRDTAASSSSAK